MDILQGPDDETFKRIQEELGEDPDRLENNIRLLEEWMACQPHLPKNYDRRMLPVYLRGCKHDMEKTKKKLARYFVIKSTIPELFFNRDPERKDILEVVENTELAIMPALTPQGYRVTIHKIKPTDINKFKVDLLMARGTLSTCLRTVMEKPIAGDLMIFDATDITGAHAATLLTPITRRCVIDGPEAYPNRIRQVHIICPSPILEKVIGIIKSMMKEKLRNRIWVHLKPEALKDFCPAYCLPNEYGGTAGRLEDFSRRTHEFTIRNFQWIKEQEDVMLLGPLPEEYNLKEEYGRGAEGSFRKLAID